MHVPCVFVLCALVATKPFSDSESPGEAFSNNLAPQVPNATTTATDGQEPPNDGSAGAKRIACVLCRKKKLRCDGARPECSTCKRLSHDCAYDEARKKSGPKRGYVKLLEQRLRGSKELPIDTTLTKSILEHVEALLQSQDASNESKDASRPDTASAYAASTLHSPPPKRSEVRNEINNGPTPIQDTSVLGTFPLQQPSAHNNTGEADFSWDIIGLGLEEPLPPLDVMEELWDSLLTSGKSLG